MAISKQRHFEILREVLASVEEQGSITLDVAAAIVGLGPAELRDLLDPVLYLEFRERGDGDIVSMTSAFLLTSDDVLQLDQGHWLRNLTVEPPDPGAALSLLVAGTTMQAIATAPTPDLDCALQKLADVVDVILQLPVDVPACLEIVQDAAREGRSLRIRYLPDGADEARENEIFPWHVFAKWGHWYAQGPSLEEADPHYYRVDRMLDASIGDVDFDPPADNEIPDWFDLSDHARTVRVRLRGATLESLPAPHQLGDPTDCGDGVVELDVTVNGDRRLEHLLVSLPADAVVVAPPEYAELRRSHAARLAVAYL